MSPQGVETIRFGDRRWEPRTEDAWPCMVKRQLVDDARRMALRTVWYPRGSTEPRHVHDGTHAAVILLGSALVDGVELGPWDAIYGPGRIPHGPHEYPMGCMLFALISGGTFHTPVASGAATAELGAPAQLVVAGDHSWLPPGTPEAWTCERKLLVRDIDRRYSAALLRWDEAARERLDPFDGALGAVVLTGSIDVGGMDLFPWDVLYVPGDGASGVELRASTGCVLAVCMHGSPPSGVLVDG